MPEKDAVTEPGTAGDVSEETAGPSEVTTGGAAAGGVPAEAETAAEPEAAATEPEAAAAGPDTTAAEPSEPAVSSAPKAEAPAKAAAAKKAPVPAKVAAQTATPAAKSAPAPKRPRRATEAVTDAPRTSRRKVREGIVVSNGMEKTAVVVVIERVRHPRYAKTVQRTKRLYAHDETNDVRVGDRVRLTETRPQSKLKRWRVERVLERAR
jgi:small subunit ribosomal protein S17